MTKILQVTVKEKKMDGTSVYEGVAKLEGGTPFKLTKSRSTETKFSTRSSLTQSATNFAKRFGLELDIASKAAAKTTGTAKATRSRKAAGAEASDSVIA